MNDHSDGHVPVQEWGLFNGHKHNLLSSGVVPMKKAECLCSWSADKEFDVHVRWAGVVGCIPIERNESRIYSTYIGSLVGCRRFVAAIFMRCPDCRSIILFPVERPLYEAIRLAVPHWPKS
jgi:hypothetical protein